MPKGRRLINAPLGASATAATSSEAATAAAAEASSVEWFVLTLSGTVVLAYKRRRAIGEGVEHLYTEVANISMHGRHSREHFRLVHEGLDVCKLSEQELRSLNKPIYMIKQDPKSRWWFMRGTNTWAAFFSSNKMPTLWTMPNIGGQALSWPGSAEIEATCKRLAPQTFDEVVWFSARQWYPVLVHSGYIEQARIMLLHFLLTQNGILILDKEIWPNGLQLDLFDLHRILMALERVDSLAFLTMMHNCNAIDILDPFGRWKQAASDHHLLPLTAAADRFLSDQEASAQISDWLVAFIERKDLVR